MVEPRLPWPKPLIKIKRYCIKEIHGKYSTSLYIVKYWVFRYSDGSEETLTMTEKNNCETIFEVVGNIYKNPEVFKK